ncbi:hypothetical protein BCR41DRAFT_426244 [Lobosporangium transversale]|uniref:Transmembrane protein n=1 Tax=Lobosporangium transversale TaxID=64571 RepID=A0A1Y2G9G9_9FUNG|nr:hypothetical protein BCR41DRAFT_426244 [Lobosporangium transversale]ORZ01847.1 hypothetical protein BCR41DRAFT_426244 [Lobosporangium transversale]|eukprot:XP_021876144.1 hypothetical protein BCR41DRAFT_426244 [Lobosporangium transversale]
MPVNYRTGANVDDYDSTESDLQGNSVNDVTRPQLARHVRQEKMLKRSSQFRLPVHRRNSPDHSLPHGSQEQGWGQRWRKLSKKLKSKKISSLGVVEPDSNDRSQGVDDHKNNDLSEDEKAKLKALIQKKKLSHDQLLDVNVDASQHMDRPRSCMSLAWVTVLICMFMFLYNGVLSVLVFQASRFPNVDTSVPIFALGLLLVFTAILPIFGLWACWLLVRSYRSSSNSPSSSRRPQMLFKIFHLLYFFTAFVIFGCMLGWLGLNKIQTGSWDRMSLKASSLLESSPTGSPLILKFESILRPDPIDPDMWIINPIIWIVSFATIWLTQVYSWYRLVAFAKKMRRETIK